MTKKDIIDHISRSTGATKTDVSVVLDEFVELIHDRLSQGGDVAYPGLGKFEVSRRAARMGRNPQTGNVVNIAAKNGVRFKASSKLKESANSSLSV